MPLYLRLLSPRPLSPALPFGFGVGFRHLFSTFLAKKINQFDTGLWAVGGVVLAILMDTHPLFQALLKYIFFIFA